MYHIACFPPANESSTEEVEIIHNGWLSPGKSSCLFPPFMRGQLRKALESGMVPNNNWKRYNMRILKSYDSYYKAQEQLSSAELTSNLESDSDHEMNLPKSKKQINKNKRRHHNSLPDSEIEDEQEGYVAKKHKELPLPAAITSTSNHSSDTHFNFTGPNFLHSAQSTSRQEQYLSPSPLNNVLQQINSNTTTSAFEKKVIRWMEKTDLVMKENHNILSNILLCLQSKNSDEQIQTSIPSLPLGTLKDLESFEEFLENSENFKKAVQFLSGKGGKDVNYATRQTLKAVITAELASQFNWAGRGEKTAFKELKIKKLIVYAVRQNRCCKNAEEKDIEESIKLFLKYAPLKLKYANKD